jgi:hypothetical protein
MFLLFIRFIRFVSFFTCRFQSLRPLIAFHLIRSTGWWIGSGVSLNKILNCRIDRNRLRPEILLHNEKQNFKFSFVFSCCLIFTYDAGFSAGPQ